MRQGVLVAVAVLACSVASPALGAPRGETRTVVFVDGPVPRIEVSGERYVRGELDLEIKFDRVNTLCFAYAADDRAPQPVEPARPPAFSSMVSSATGAVSFPDAVSAARAAEAQLGALGQISREAAERASLDPVWDACRRADAALVTNDQYKRIAEATALLGQKMAEGGVWTKTLVESLRVLASLRGFARETGGARPVVDLARTLEEYVTATLALLDRLASELDRARARLASAPTPLVHHYATGQKVVVKVTRTRLHRGLVEHDSERVTLVADAYRTLAPIWLDVGVGPSITARAIEGWGVGTMVRDGQQAAYVVRTKDELNVDGVVSLSGYIWGPRYLDDTVWDSRQLLPRPMIGMSMRQPFSSLYAGIQVDPVQFLDLSLGVRFYSSERLMTPREDKRAFTLASGEPAPPVTEEKTVSALFVSLTASTDLVQRWIQRSF
jgi:hypothetical protein